MGLSQIGGTSYARLVTKQNIAGETYLSATANTNAGSAGAFGSWVEIASSTGSEYAITSLAIYAPAGPTSSQVPVVTSVGYGGAGSEVQLGQYLTLFSSIQSGSTSTWGGTLQVPTPWRVAAGSRLAVRVAFAQAANATYTIYVGVIPWASLEGN